MEPQAVRAQLERILSSAAFAEAGRAGKFLRFVVENALAGRADSIKESVIAVEVLGRPPSFDSRNDAIVRVEAGRLRSRLSSYYQSEGAADPIVIELPKGGYVPKIEERTHNAEPPAVRPSARRIGLIWGTAALAAAAIVAGILFNSRHLAPSYDESIRLSVVAPEGAALHNTAISPDGRYLAFSAHSGNATRLWIRPLNAAESKPLPGTDGAAQPFWSPDGTSIGFFASEQLRTVPLSGGPVRNICQVQAAFGGTWGPGIILFAQRPSGTVFQVPVAGGKPAAVTSLDHEHGEVAHVFPYFLPDGRHFLYSVIARAPAEPALRVAALGEHGFKVLINADLGGVYMPPYAGRSGALLFAYRGALLSQAFNPADLQLSGTPVQVAPQVRRYENRADLSASRNGIVAYRPGSDGDRQLIWFDRQGHEAGDLGPPNNYSTFQLSPDDRRVAVQSNAGGRAEIWIMDTTRGSLSRVAAESDEAIAPIWSPDASELIFSATTASVMTLVRQRLDQLNPSSVVAASRAQIATDWSMDGRFLAYARFLMEPGAFVKLLSDPAEVPGRQYGKGGREYYATFSPSVSSDGPRWLAYSSDETGQNEVHVTNFPAGDRKWQVSTRGGWLPHWRRDGRELYYLAPDGRLMAVDTATWSAPVPLFETSIAPFSYPALPRNVYAVSRDGQRFLINRTRKGTAADSIMIIIPK